MNFKERMKAFGLQVLVAFLAILGGYLQPIKEKGTLPPATGQTPNSQPAPAPAPAAKPWDAIGRIQIGSYGCSATIIGKRLASGEYDLLSAAHCLPAGIKTGVMRLENGKQFGIVLTAINRETDCAWLRTIGDVGELPYADLAENLPAEGEQVWHGGYGEHNPRNKESGTVVRSTNDKGQSQFWISVSSGDSGGGIVCDKTGKVLSSVCCTTQKNARADVWGCSVNSIRSLRPKENVNAFEWTPVDIRVVAE